MGDITSPVTLETPWFNAGLPEVTKVFLTASTSLCQWRFVVPGQPTPWTVWARRSAPHQGFLEMQAWQEQIRAVVRHQWGKKALLAGGVVVDTAFYLRYPQTAPQRNARAMAIWRQKHLAMKPDLDNLRKSCSDGVASVLFLVGDQQVVSSRASKHFAEPGQEPYTVITVGKA